MVQIPDKQTNNFLTEKIMEGSRAWIKVYGRPVKYNDNYYFVGWHGLINGYSNWYRRLAPASKYKEDLAYACLMFNKKGKWGHLINSYSLSFICEKNSN